MTILSSYQENPSFLGTSTISPTLTSQLEAVIKEGWQRGFYRDHWGQPALQDVLNMLRTGEFYKLPITRKQDLRDHWNQVMVFTDASDLVSSSGTTGRPVDVPVNKEQEQLRVLRVRRLLRELGVKPGSRVLQLLSLNDLFTLGPLVWQAIKAEGGLAIRCSPQRLERVLQIFEYIQPDFVIGNPYVLVRMAEEAGERWPTPEKLPNRAFLAVAAVFDETLQINSVASAVNQLWGFDLTINQYGTSELGPIAHECQQHQGLHIHDDHHLVELIDPASGLPVTSPNQPGEVVLTGLTLPRGFVPIRYGTGDIAAWIRHDACSCGRKSPRLGPVLGRVDHQLKVFGQTIFPDFLLDIADSFPFVRRSAVRVRKNQLGNDEVALLLVPAQEQNPEAVRLAVANKVSQSVAVTPDVEIVTEAHLDYLEKAASQHTNMVKVPRFFDFRQETISA